MLCYKDKTFCNAPCATMDCPRMLTDAVRKAAQSFGLPCSVANFAVTCADFTREQEKGPPPN